MRCEKVRRKLGAYVDGELTPRAAAEIGRHLESCDACRDGLARLRHLAAYLERAEVPPVPEGLASRVMAEARRRATEGGPARLAGRTPSGLWWPLNAPMRAAAVLVFAVGLVLGTLMAWDTGRSPDAEPGTGSATDIDALETYNADYLTDAPSGSLAEAYLSMVSSLVGEE